MGKQKLKKRRRRSPQGLPQKTKVKQKPLIGAIMALLFERGLDVMGYTNPCLGWFLWGLSAALGWWWLTTFEWSYSKLLKLARNRSIMWIGYLSIVVFFGVFAYNAYVRGEKPNLISILQENEQQRLDKEYSLGYALIAFSGDKKIFISGLDRFEVDWDSITVSRDNRNFINITLDRLYDKYTEVGFTAPVFSCPAIPGAKHTLMDLGSVRITIECLKAEPIGLFGVLGFAERTDRE